MRIDGFLLAWITAWDCWRMKRYILTLRRALELEKEKKRVK
jgi:hypothetical protein